MAYGDVQPHVAGRAAAEASAREMLQRFEAAAAEGRLK